MSIAGSQKIGNQCPSGPSNATLGHILKEWSIILQVYLFNYVQVYLKNQFINLTCMEHLALLLI